MIKTETLRRQIDNCLRKEGRPRVNEQEWQYAQDQRWIDGALDGEISIDEIAVNIVDARRTFGSDKTVEAVRLERGVPGGRKYALSLLLENQARARPDVREFRRKHLASEPLPIPKVEK